MPTTPAEQTSLIVQLYELLRDKCTNGPEGRRSFTEHCNAVLRKSALNPGESAGTSWDRSWNKPLYANQRSQGATEVANRIREAGLFDTYDLQRLPTDDACLKGLRDPKEKLRRVRALAARWAQLHELHASAADRAAAAVSERGAVACVDDVRRMLGVPGISSRKTGAQTLFAALTAIKGFGPITSLHLLTDLGYPVYKPDRWVVRFAAVDPTCRAALEARLPGGLAALSEKFLLRNLDLVQMAVDQLARQFLQGPRLEEIDLGGDRDFRAYRFVDLMVSKFGMDPEEEFGLRMSGQQWLVRDQTGEAAKYAPLLQIAREMAEDRRKGREAGSPRAADPARSDGFRHRQRWALAMRRDDASHLVRLERAGPGLLLAHVALTPEECGHAGAPAGRAEPVEGFVGSRLQLQAEEDEAWFLGVMKACVRRARER